jgi:hypothetical protein
MAEIEVDKAAEVAEAGSGDRPQLVVGQIEDLKDGGKGLKEAGLDVRDVVEGEIQGPVSVHPRCGRQLRRKMHYKLLCLSFSGSA